MNDSHALPYYPSISVTSFLVCVAYEWMSFDKACCPTRLSKTIWTYLDHDPAGTSMDKVPIWCTPCTWTTTLFNYIKGGQAASLQDTRRSQDCTSTKSSDQSQTTHITYSIFVQPWPYILHVMVHLLRRRLSAPSRKAQRPRTSSSRLRVLFQRNSPHKFIKIKWHYSRRGGIVDVKLQSRTAVCSCQGSDPITTCKYCRCTICARRFPLVVYSPLHKASWGFIVCVKRFWPEF